MRSAKLYLYLLGICILLAGLAGAAIIYFAAGDDRADTIAYEFVGGQAYAITAQDSKAYRHELERFGGKAAVFADDLNRWFAGWWSAKGLACLLAALSVGAALVCFRAAQRAAPGPDRQPPADTGQG